MSRGTVDRYWLFSHVHGHLRPETNQQNFTDLYSLTATQKAIERSFGWTVSSTPQPFNSLHIISQENSCE